VRTESAREVRMIGIRAPSTMPAALACARNVRFLANILPASRSGTNRIWVRPATADSVPLIRAAVGSTALSKASGPSSNPPVIERSDIACRVYSTGTVSGMLICGKLDTFHGGAR
jgi:hypothetical protein